MMRELGENAAPVMAGGKERLESAIAAPQWAGLHADADLAEQAALVSIRIAQAHALVDNNKRLAYMVGVIFLRENGHPLPAEHALAFAKKIEAALEQRATVTSMAAWLREIIDAS